MFCSISEDSKIDDIHRRILKCTHKEEHGTLEYLINKYDDSSIHVQNIRSLMIFIYRVIHPRPQGKFFLAFLMRFC